jgi:hypothetical protein
MSFLAVVLAAVAFGLISASVNPAEVKADPTVRLPAPTVGDSPFAVHADSLHVIAPRIQHLDSLSQPRWRQGPGLPARRVVTAPLDNMPIVVPDLSRYPMPVVSWQGWSPMPILTPEGWHEAPATVDSSESARSDSTTDSR